MGFTHPRNWHSLLLKGIREEANRNWRWLFIKISNDAIDRAKRFDIGTDSQALSFTFILSLVPLLAIAFTFFKLFGGLQHFLENTLKPIMERNFPETVANQLKEFMDTFVSNLQTGTLGVVSFVTLLATVIALMLNTEQSFNRIFEAKNQRSLFKKIGSYWIMLSATPLVIVLSTAKSTDLLNTFQSNAGILNQYGVINFLRFTVGHLVQIVGFGALFLVLPERKPKIRSALWGAVVTHLIFQLLAYINVKYATFVFSNSTNLRLYGSLPLMVLVFLIWVRLVWLGILFGACVCASVDKHRDEMKSIKKRIPWQAPHETILNCVRALEFYVERFTTQKPPPTQSEVASHLELSLEELEMHQERLQRNQLITPIRFKDRESFVATAAALRCRENPTDLLADLLEIPTHSVRTEAWQGADAAIPKESSLVAESARLLARIRQG